MLKHDRVWRDARGRARLALRWQNYIEDMAVGRCYGLVVYVRLTAHNTTSGSTYEPVMFVEACPKTKEERKQVMRTAADMAAIKYSIGDYKLRSNP